MPETIVPGLIQERLAHAKVWYLDAEDLLVDTGLASEWETLETFLEGVGGPSRVLITHSHGDHVGNLERVVERYDPTVLYPANEPIDDAPLTEEDVTRVSDGEVLGDGVRAIEVPGHTPGICAVYLEDSRTLLASDVLDGSDRRGLVPGYLLPPPAVYTWDSGKAESNLTKLLDFDFETAVVTHGTNVDSEARLKLERFLDFTEHYRKELLETL